MARVFTSERTGAGVYVFSDDHCPPHVHARHRGDGWIARVGFSYYSRTLELVGILPSHSILIRRTLKRLLDDIGTELVACRRIWWETRRTVCLDNQWVVVENQMTLRVTSRTASGARPVDAVIYDVAHERLRLTFRDGTAAEVSTRQ